jgi:hypothetical protein
MISWQFSIHHRLYNLTGTRVMAGVGGSTLADGGEDDVDGCDVEFQDGDVTPDAELPPASGGVVAPVLEAQADEDGIDGCDIEFGDGDVTRDEDLPVAVGGVA